RKPTPPLLDLVAAAARAQGGLLGPGEPRRAPGRAPGSQRRGGAAVVPEQLAPGFAAAARGDQAHQRQGVFAVHGPAWAGNGDGALGRRRMLRSGKAAASVGRVRMLQVVTDAGRLDAVHDQAVADLVEGAEHHDVAGELVGQAHLVLEEHGVLLAVQALLDAVDDVAAFAPDREHGAVVHALAGA